MRQEMEPYRGPWRPPPPPAATGWRTCTPRKGPNLNLRFSNQRIGVWNRARCMNILIDLLQSLKEDYYKPKHKESTIFNISYQNSPEILRSRGFWNNNWTKPPSGMVLLINPEENEGRWSSLVWLGYHCLSWRLHTVYWAERIRFNIINYVVNSLMAFILGTWLHGDCNYLRGFFYFTHGVLIGYSIQVYASQNWSIFLPLMA